MEEPKARDSLLAFSGVMAFVIALGAVIYSIPALKGSRPYIAEIREVASQKVRARLWEDPFCAVIDHAKAKDRPAAIPADRYNFDNSQESQLAEMREDIKAHLEKGGVTVLGVMVFGGPYAENTEYRIRNRYAVLSGLGRTKFVPEDSEYLGFFRLQSKAMDNRPDSPISLTNIMPYEWLSRDSGPQPESVLLLWINEDLLQKTLQPLDHLVRLFSSLDQLRPRDSLVPLRFKVIGPAGSTTLLQMLKELQVARKKALPLQMYAATATADTVLLQGGTCDGKIEKAPDNLAAQFQQWQIITFDRSICTDRELTAALIDELGRRGVDLLGAQGWFLNLLSRKRSDSRDRVALVAEWDTFYGRSLPQTFINVLGEKLKKVGQEDCPDLVYRYSYLRGLDGKLPGEQEQKAKESPKNTGDRKEEDLQGAEEPTGKSQYDYLRRLGDRIYRRDQELRRKGQGSIKAIGVLGSDFYDKYLVLQALSQKLPDVIFFTTDLDARYLYATYNKWTRNLVIASGFGLALREDLQADVPPFRDCFQTAIFFATLRAFADGPCLALKNEDKEEQRLKTPRIFEIGRSQPIDLTVETNEAKTKTIHAIFKGAAFSKVIGRHKWVVLSGLIMSLFLLIFLYLSSPVTKGLFNWIREHPGGTLFIATMFLAGLVAFSYYILPNPAEEPFGFLQGVSVWPTEIIRLIAMGLSWFFLIRSNARLKENRQKLIEDYGLEVRDAAISAEEPREPYQQKSGTTVWKACKESLGKCCYDWGIDNGEEKEKKGSVGMNELWEEYRRRGSWGCRLRRFVPYAIVMTIVLFWVIQIKSVRGSYSPLIDYGIRFLTDISILVLIFFVFDVTRLGRSFINLIRQGIEENRLRWSPESLAKFTAKMHRAGEGLKEWMAVGLMAELTAVVGKLIYYPFIVMFVILLARCRYFEYARISLGAAIFIVGLIIVYAWNCAWSLRRAAEKARAVILDRLDKKLSQAVTEGWSPARVEEIEFVLKEVKATQSGAFAPYLQQPVVQALLLSFGIGGYHLIDFFTK